MLSVVAVCTILMAAGTPGAPVLPGAAEYEAARNEELAGRFAQAIAGYGVVAGTDNPFAEYARLRAALCREASGDTAGAAAAYQSVIKDLEYGPWTRPARLYLARLLNKSGKFAEAAPLFDAALADTPPLWWLHDFCRLAAENRLAFEPAKPENYAYFRDIAERSFYAKPRVEASQRLVASPLAEDRALAVYNFLRSSEYESALSVLRASGALKSPGSEAPFAAADIEKLLDAGLNETPGNVDLVTRLAAANTSSVWMPAWLYYGTRIALARKKAQDAATCCDLLATHFPDKRETGESIWKLAESLAGDAAAEQYLRVATTCPSHRLAPFALFHAGRIPLEQGKEADGLKIWDLLIAKYPGHARTGEAAYLAARRLLEKGDKEGARKYLMSATAAGVGDYFAHRAFSLVDTPNPLPTQNLRIDGQSTVLRPFPVADRNPGPIPPLIDAVPAVQRMRFLALCGLEESEWEALELCYTFRGHPFEGTVYRVLAECGLSHSVLEFADAHGWGVDKGKKTLERLRLEFPRAYWPYVKEVARETSLDPYLILALAKQESTFRPGLTSRSGAAGVMQIMPGTASYIAKIEPEIEEADVQRLKDPRVSFRMGAFYLLRMIERGNANLLYAVASYNAGPGNCAKWRRSFASYDHDAFVTAIPLAETADYVRKVLSNYAAYWSLYPQQDGN